jgi:signal transduction histidine kinase
LFLINSILSILFIEQLKEKRYTEIINFQNDEYNSQLNELKDIVNSAYQMIDVSYNNSEIEYGFEEEDITNEIINILSINRLIFTLENIRELKFSNDGFISINDFNAPFTVRLHPQKPVLEGSDWIFYVNKENPVNIYELFHNTIVEGNGEGEVNYNFYEFNNDSLKPMLGYVKLYEKLNWVIGSSISLYESQKTNEYQLLRFNSDFKKLNIKILVCNAVLLIIVTLLFLFFPNGINNAKVKNN